MMTLQRFSLIAIGFLGWLAVACTPSPGPPPPTPTPQPPPQVHVVAEGLLGPIGLAALPDGGLLVAEEGSGEDDDSAGVSLIRPTGEMGRLISGLSSGRDSGDLSGVPLVALAPAGDKIYLGHFGDGQLWTLPLSAEEQAGGLPVPDTPLTIEQLTPAMLPLNDVQLTNPFDLAFDPDGLPVVTDASGNGVAKENPDGSTRFIHRFDPLPNPATPADTLQAVPTGIARVGQEYYVTLTGGCPYPEGSGLLVAIDENRNQRTVVDGLNMPIDVAQGPDGTLWVLEFARFDPDASCFSGSGYQANTGRLSRLLPGGQLEPVLTELNFPGAVLPMPDGSLYLSEVFPGRVLQVTFGQPVGVERPQPLVAQPAPVATEPAQPLILRDVAAEAGLNFQHGAFVESLGMDPVAMMGGGLCWLDFDGDGWLDLYAVNSHALHEVELWAERGGLPRNALFRNQGDGTFADASAGSGADLALRGNGCIAGDIDQDGDPDIYVTADGPNALLLNQGDGTFVEGAAAAGIAAPEWSTAAAMGDVDGDGLVDLFVASYIDLENKVPEPVGLFPQDFYGLLDHLYRNRGDGTFEDVALQSGLIHEERGLGAVFSDLDLDGDLDLYVANDGHPNRLYLNQGQGVFQDVTQQAGVGDRGSGMGVNVGDYSGDGWFDIVVTNFDKEYNALYHSQALAEGALEFEYATFHMGLQGFGQNQTGWGVSWLDLDLDTDLDLITAQGKVPITDIAADGEQLRYYQNKGDGTFIDASRAVGLREVGPRLARGMAAADYDNDGDVDLALATIAGSLSLLQVEGAAGNWLTVSLSGFTPGAKLEATLPDGKILVRELRCGSSYLASEDPRFHLGLGAADHVQRLLITLPDGQRLEFEDVPAGQISIEVSSGS